ncbi:zinc finger-like domain-containing protein, partial [Myxococcus sp. CA018]
CEPCKGRGVQWGTHNECSICKGTGTTSPTAPPGLREAVGPDKSLLRRLANYTRHAPTCNPAGSTSDGACTCGLDDTRNAALAAYDATGGDTVLCPGCKQMAPATEMHTRCTMCAAYEDERTKSATLEASPDAEDAAKYRAAVAAAAPLVPLWRECIERNGRGMLAFPATAAEMAPVIAALATPPTGPGGGVESELVRCVGCSLTEGHFAECPFGRRARIAPAPDDGEPLSPDDAALIDAAWRKHSAIPPAPDAPSLSPAPDSAPASSSPQTDVVWQWGRNGGWKVSPDGGLYCKVWLHGGVDGGWVREVADDQPAIGQVAIQLARALAEAKREVETLKAAAEGDLKTTADMHPADRANASLAWGCAGSLQAALRRERANRMEFARKAAEEMREQAAQWILGVPCLGALTPSFVADNLRALPLLGKAVRRG